MAACLLLLGWTTEVVGLFVKNEKAVRDHQICLTQPDTLTIVGAAKRHFHSRRSPEYLRRRFCNQCRYFSLCSCLLIAAYSIGTVQSCSRSLIVDTLPITQQQLGSAWASRMSAVGHLIGYGIGSIDMVATFGTFLGDTQFKKMCMVAAFALVSATFLTSWAVKERIMIANMYEAPNSQCVF